MSEMDLPELPSSSIMKSEPRLVELPSSSLVKSELSGAANIDSIHSRPPFYSHTTPPSSDLLVLDSIYIKKHLGIPLTLALAEIVAKRPSDPIHYLGHWLLKWRWNQEQKQCLEDKVHALIEDRKKIADKIRVCRNLNGFGRFHIMILSVIAYRYSINCICRSDGIAVNKQDKDG